MKILLVVLFFVEISNGFQSNSRENSISTLKDYLQTSHNFNLSNCSNEFVLSSTSKFYDGNSSIEIKFESILKNRTFSRIFLFAEDKTGKFVGRWETNDSQLKKNLVSALSESSTVDKTRVRARWFSNENLTEKVFFKAFVVERESMIFLDCYEIEADRRKFFENSTNNNNSFPSPTVDVGMNVTWTFDPKTKNTVVRMTITNLKTAEWAAIGLGTERAMGRAHVFICKRLSDDTITVERYINPSGHQYPEPAAPDAGGVFTATEQIFRDGNVICQFTLSNFTENSFDDLKSVPALSQTTPYYPLFAVGLLDSENEPEKHPKDSRKAQIDLVQLNRKEIILYKLSNGNSVDTKKLIRIHGIFMVFTWIFLVSTGILISRYFRRIELAARISSVISWFHLHRLMMSLASISTIVGFLLIFTALQGNWVEKSWSYAFAHSILGILVIGLTFFQPFIALFRCSTTSSYRFIFNFFHRSIGFLTLIVSLIVIFLATYLRQFSNETARISIIIWSIWLVFILSLFESIDFYFRRQNNYVPLENLTEVHAVRVDQSNSQKATNSEKRWKCCLLLIHLFISGFLSIFISLLIYRS